MKKRKKLEGAPPIGDRLLTLREAADVLRLSTRTMREYASRGELSSARSLPYPDADVCHINREDSVDLPLSPVIRLIGT
jgi:hypothetical protein